MNSVFIYALQDPVTGEVRYIGKTDMLRKRFNKHLSGAKVTKTHCAYWLRGLLKAGLKPKLIVLDEVPEVKWGFFERAYIKIYRELGARLTNLTSGGEGGGVVGRPCPEERRKKISDSLVGRTLSLEHRASISAATVGVPCPQRNIGGRKHTAETIDKISGSNVGKHNHDGSNNPFFGKKHTEETCKKISAHFIGKPANVGIDNPFFGKTHTLESRARMRAGQLQRRLREKQHRI